MHVDTACTSSPAAEDPLIARARALVRESGARPVTYATVKKELVSRFGAARWSERRQAVQELLRADHARRDSCSTREAETRPHRPAGSAPSAAGPAGACVERAGGNRREASRSRGGSCSSCSSSSSSCRSLRRASGNNAWSEWMTGGLSDGEGGDEEGGDGVIEGAPTAQRYAKWVMEAGGKLTLATRDTPAAGYVLASDLSPPGL